MSCPNEIVQRSINEARQIFMNSSPEKLNLTSEQFNSMKVVNHNIAQLASFCDKKKHVLNLYNAVEHMRTGLNHNQLAADNYEKLEIHFRGLCNPLFNNLDSFLLPTEEFSQPRN